MQHKERQLLLKSFYLGTDVVSSSRQLLGKVLATRVDGVYTAGIITETEAYAGAIDRASHAFGNRRTARTEVMFGEGGRAYVYLIYGIHCLFNVVIGPEEVPLAVLVRGIEPLEGVDIMLRRRQLKEVKPQLGAGPGAAAQALGITRLLNGEDLTQSNQIWIEDRGIKVPAADIASGTRVGVAYAQEDALLPYRFFIKGNPFVSKAKGIG